MSELEQLKEQQRRISLRLNEIAAGKSGIVPLRESATDPKAEETRNRELDDLGRRMGIKTKEGLRVFREGRRANLNGEAA